MSLHQHHLVVAEVEGRREHVLRLLPQAGEDLRVRPGDPGRGVPQAVAVRVLADRDEQLADGPAHALGVVRARRRPRWAVRQPRAWSPGDVARLDH